MEVYRRSSWLVLLLGFFFLSTNLPGLQGEVDGQGPTESECRPYIEKALKELEIGESEPNVPPPPPDTRESDEELPTIEITTEDPSAEEKDVPESKEASEDIPEAEKENEIENEDDHDGDDDDDDNQSEEEESAENQNEDSVEDQNDESSETVTETEDDEESSEQPQGASTDEQAQQSTEEEETAKSDEVDDQQASQEEEPESLINADEPSQEKTSAEEATSTAEDDDNVPKEEPTETESAEEEPKEVEPTEEEAKETEQQETEDQKSGEEENDDDEPELTSEEVNAWQNEQNEPISSIEVEDAFLTSREREILTEDEDLISVEVEETVVEEVVEEIVKAVEEELLTATPEEEIAASTEDDTSAEERDEASAEKEDQEESQEAVDDNEDSPVDKADSDEEEQAEEEIETNVEDAESAEEKSPDIDTPETETTQIEEQSTETESAEEEPKEVEQPEGESKEAEASEEKLEKDETSEEEPNEGEPSEEGPNESEPSREVHSETESTEEETKDADKSEEKYEEVALEDKIEETEQSEETTLKDKSLEKKLSTETVETKDTDTIEEEKVVIEVTAEESEKEEENTDTEEETLNRTRREAEDEERATESEDKEETDESSKEEPEVEDLVQEIEDIGELRPRDHVNHILGLDEESSETEQIVGKTSEIILKELKKLYDSAIKPLETLYKYRDLSNRHFGDAEIFSKPLILFMGPWSGGKSTIVNYLLDIEYNETCLHTGAEPSPAYFNILMYGDEPEVLDGTELAADYTFSGLQKFGQGLEERLRGYKLPSKLLKKVNVVEIPGILEVRKQVSRVFPFNDACQWFIDRADIIFLVYDPSKLDVGPETEAILDQLKGREYQTRIVLNKADQVKPEELMRVQGALIWNISPLMSSAQPPVMYTTSLWSKPYEPWAPVRLLQAQERAFLKDLRLAIDKRIDNKIASARRFAVRVRNHAKMVDCYLTTYYNHKSVFGNRKQVSDEIINHPQNYHIYEGLSTLTNISRYDLPDPDVYRDFFNLNALYDFQQLSATCTYFRGCPINRLDVAIAYDLPELVGKNKRLVENALSKANTESSTRES